MSKDNDTLKAVDTAGAAPVTESDLHAYVDEQLDAERRSQVEAFLASSPEERARIADWRQQNQWMRGILAPVMGEALPVDLSIHPPDRAWPWRAIAAAVFVAVVSAGASWSVRGVVDARQAADHDAQALRSPEAGDAALADFARRAAVAHVVYSPDARRPVEVGADQEQALVAWLTRRLGIRVRAPSLGTLGYELIGGRLLPGKDRPVAQFMYGGSDGQRLTLYVTTEVSDQDTSFHFGQDGDVKVFYWVENHLGYAISAGADREALLRVSQEVYRQLKPG